MQKEACGCAQHARDGGVLPASGFPRDSGMQTSDKRTRCKHRVHLIQHMHSVHGRRLGVIPSKRAFSERIEFVEGSRRSRAVVEVVVHGSSWEVVVHVAMVVVHLVVELGRSGTRRR